jgi:hypothetical protein
MEKIINVRVVVEAGRSIKADIDGSFCGIGIHGYPMGRGSSVDSAVADLIYRANIGIQGGPVVAGEVNIVRY